MGGGGGEGEGEGEGEGGVRERVRERGKYVKEGEEGKGGREVCEGGR